MKYRIKFYLIVILSLLLAKHYNDNRTKEIALLSYREGCLYAVKMHWRCDTITDEYDKRKCTNDSIGWCRTRTTYFEIDVEREGLRPYFRLDP